MTSLDLTPHPASPPPYPQRETMGRFQSIRQRAGIGRNQTLARNTTMAGARPTSSGGDRQVSSWTSSALLLWVERVVRCACARRRVPLVCVGAVATLWVGASSSTLPPGGMLGADLGKQGTGRACCARLGWGFYGGAHAARVCHTHQRPTRCLPRVSVRAGQSARGCTASPARPPAKRQTRGSACRALPPLRRT